MHLDFAPMAALDIGGYVSILKILPVIVLLLVWARLMTWIDKDAVAAHLPRYSLNTFLYGSGLLAFALFFLLPFFIVALAVNIVILGAGVGVYLGLRNKEVGLKDLRKEFNAFLSSFGRKEKPVEVKPGQVQLFNRAGKPMPSPEAEHPTRPGYDASEMLLADPLKRGAELIELKPTAEGASVSAYVVDGYPYAGTSFSRDSAAAGIAYLKGAAGLDVEDRRKPQTGKVKAALDGKKLELEVSVAGSTAGETLRIQVDPKNRHRFALNELGLLQHQVDNIKAAIAENRGVVLLAGPKGMGLTSILYAVFRAHDAFLQHLQTIEHAPTEDLEGITQNKLPLSATAAEELKLVQWVTSQQPDAVLIDYLVNPESAREIARYCSENHRVYVGMRTGSTLDAIAAWRKLVGDDSLAASELKMAVAGRVMRRLCMACKVAYAPDPERLRKMNMDPARVQQLFEARKSPMVDQKGRPIPCQFCQELRYKGRFGVYEQYVIDDEVKAAIVAGASQAQLQTLFRKRKGRYIQEIALQRVEAGDTSVDEVRRVMGAGESAQRPAASGGAAPT